MKEPHRENAMRLDYSYAPVAIEDRPGRVS